MYRGVVRPCMEYASHIWGGSFNSNLKLLDRVESKAFRLINSPLTASLQTLSDRRNVASLALYYRYYNGHCSSELYTHIPPPLRRPRATRQGTHSHTYSVQLPHSRLENYRRSFFYRAGLAWNGLSSSIFPSYYNMNIFKRRMSGHVGHAS